MSKKSPLGLAIAALLAAPISAQAEIDVSVELKNETAFYTRGGQVTGQARTTKDNRENDTGDVMKFENSARTASGMGRRGGNSGLRVASQLHTERLPA